MSYVTAVLPTDQPPLMHQAVDEAVRLLKEGEVVALPTETVYGLAANALDAAAVAKIFEAKERPTFDPVSYTHLQQGMLQPPRKSVTAMPEPMIIAAYSPMKNRANFIELYSVW